MTYREALEKILSIPMFQNVGVSAFVPTLDGSIRLNSMLDNPFNSYPTIHIAGTNGKGSSSSMLTSVLMEAGYKVGCYTSPHLTDYRERVRINGAKVSEKVVCEFMDRIGDAIDIYHPSFFEVTTALAFYAFQRECVDVAVIETGLGGLTDSTNIITPILSIITNIGYDHKYILGDTLSEIAAQKGGIIKQGVPAVIGEHGEESDKVFTDISSDIIFAQDRLQVVSHKARNKEILLSDGRCLDLDLEGEYQLCNLVTVLTAIDKLRDGGMIISEESVSRGLANVCRNTSFEGRWQRVSDDPLVVCDTGHNEDGIRYVSHQLSSSDYHKLYIIMGFMADKEVDKIITLMPSEAYYIFAPASNPRSMSAESLADLRQRFSLDGEVCGSVRDAYKKACCYARADDMIFVGGSTFIVADFLDATSFER